jgi:hypothetical protein
VRLRARHGSAARFGAPRVLPASDSVGSKRSRSAGGHTERTPAHRGGRAGSWPGAFERARRVTRRDQAQAQLFSKCRGRVGRGGMRYSRSGCALERGDECRGGNDELSTNAQRLDPEGARVLAHVPPRQAGRLLAVLRAERERSDQAASFMRRCSWTIASVPRSTGRSARIAMTHSRLIPSSWAAPRGPYSATRSAT